MTKKTLITGFPRIGENRELKKALENYWSGKSSLNELEFAASEIRKKNWIKQKDAGIDFISCNDFSYYDIMLDTALMINAVPERFRNISDRTEKYFAMARGNKKSHAMEMTKWFNTNYHYIVPELDDSIEFRLDSSKLINEYKEALSLGIKTKINLIGPLTFLGLSKTSDGSDPFHYLKDVIGIYKQLLDEISRLDDEVYIQIEEPFFVKDPEEKHLSLIKGVYGELASVSSRNRIIVTTYFEHACEAVSKLADTPVWGIALDFVYGPSNLSVLDKIKNKYLVAGVVDGRNIWLNDYDRSMKLLERISEKVPGNRIIVSTSCSLLHTPYTTSNEPDSGIRQWLSFCLEKTAETAFLGKLFHSDKSESKDMDQFHRNCRIIESRKHSEIVTNPEVSERLKSCSEKYRDGNFEERNILQKSRLNLPLLATTTIGSFPQTPELRKLRRDYRKGNISVKYYEDEIRKYIDDCISFQEETGLDVLVHGEPERNDMVEYFGELLDGFHFTANGWVQSYGSRCVKPPVIYGDISRPEPMTVKWIGHAQERTGKPVKGMLTGPVTIINWSFVRNDIPRSTVAKQIAVSLSDEIYDLQEAGIKIIQVDEAAFKEGYPLRSENRHYYEEWAVDSFKTAVSSAEKETQIHTHMCYSEFNDIIGTIEAMDADVISIETSRSGNRLLNIFSTTGYDKEIGPGVYDIHSPRVPSFEEIRADILERLKVVDKNKIWINPDCGLKTRKWEEVKPALENMVSAALDVRKQL